MTVKEHLEMATRLASDVKEMEGDAVLLANAVLNIVRALEISTIAAIEAKPQEPSRLLGDLLAVIHRDGGHYQSMYGTEKAYKDAVAIVGDLRGAKPTVEPTVEVMCEAVRRDRAYPTIHADLLRNIKTAANAINVKRLRRVAERMSSVALHEAWSGPVLKMTAGEIIACLDGTVKP